ncbi:Na+/H+ antiporter subunit E [Allgaiera indica]|uniref:Multisubunit potassium/proton antiporter, PhaE subunit n=1 Tax=Allgaiera indica TaxID=765699 RepID=A0AAN4UT03_9RHOB|nr:Na+/H+ antiporter subunit E [Allgaiera indica]GHE03422.1 Na+/H+ antiporter subunit E [Allgaiera indica]SDX25279.1 multisubunit potassium/proton antiporter, PhaE subunit [Allgaiera indica]
MFLSRLVPHPFLTLLLTFVWMMLMNSVSAGAAAFGLFLGLVVPFLTQSYWPDRPRIHRPLKIVEYILVVLYDIVTANITVARIVLFVPRARLQPAWVVIPLELRSPEAITVLAGSITLTPGTLTAEVSSDAHSILVHCLHAPEPDAVRDEIKQRYERRLLEIFP